MSVYLYIHTTNQGVRFFSIGDDHLQSRPKFHRSELYTFLPLLWPSSLRFRKAHWKTIFDIILGAPAANIHPIRALSPSWCERARRLSMVVFRSSTRKDFPTDKVESYEVLLPGPGAGVAPKDSHLDDDRNQSSMVINLLLVRETLGKF